MSSFFTLPASQRKRKRNDTGPTPSSKKQTADTGAATKATSAKPKKSKRDESISGSDSEGDGVPRKTAAEDLGSEASSSDSGHEEETAAEKRLRLAERYLENVKDEVQQTGFDAEEVDRDLIAERLIEDVAETKGRLYRHIASTFAFTQTTKAPFKAHTLCTTSIAVCPPYVYTVSKDITLIKWKLPTPPLQSTTKSSSKNKNKKSPRPLPRRPTKVLSTKGSPHMSPSNPTHHSAPILTVAASPDGRFVATGGADKRLIIWATADLKPLKIFSQHRDAVTGLAFRRGTNQLYSSSKDRTIKTWSLNELSYVETLFGHQDEVVDVAALAQERCLSVGARDRTARLWKVIEETQLVFRGGGGSSSRKNRDQSKNYAEGSIDRVAMIDDELFVTGSDNGSLSLWSIHKKKPVFTIPLAHGLDPALKPEEAYADENPSEKVPSPPQPRWVTALAAVPYSDLIVSGSWDGWLRVWRVSQDKKKLEAVATVGWAGVGEKGDEATVGGNKEVQMEDTGDTTGQIRGDVEKGYPDEEEKAIKGVINDIALFERGDRGQDGLCIVAAIGTEHRLGRWQKVKGRNGAVVFEIPKLSKQESHQQDSP